MIPMILSRTVIVAKTEHKEMGETCSAVSMMSLNFMYKVTLEIITMQIYIA